MALLFCVCEPTGSATPSTTYKGLLLVLIELNPLILMLVCPPGRPELVFTCTPEIRPANAWFNDDAGRSCSSVAFTTPTDPVKSVFLTVPYPITTTSSSLLSAAAPSLMVMLLSAPTVTSLFS
ncbi:hypothetical protein D3C73_934470 [compost metagenome]